MPIEKIMTYQDPETGLWCARVGRTGRVFKARTIELARQYAEKHGKSTPAEGK